MEGLLDAADVLAASVLNNEDDSLLEQQRPDFAIPEDFSNLTTAQDILTIRGSKSKGKGWFATKSIEAGTFVLVAKPVAMVMDLEDDSFREEETEEDPMESEDAEDIDEKDDKEPRVNELLLLQILVKLKDQPCLWTNSLSQLFPRNNQDLRKLPAWVCEDDSVFIQVESLIQQLAQQPALKDAAKEISKRLPLIIRYNVLSVETCPELLSYPGYTGHSSLSGVALYHLPSFFNHSSTPNCSRWAVGDIMFFVANQNIEADQEVCISYIEHDVLCESPYRRNLMLRMDFKDRGDGAESTSDLEATIPADEEAGPDMPVVDSDVQNELMGMDPFERLTAIEELMQQATGSKFPEEESEQQQIGEADDNVMDADPGSTWFQCDIQNLRILKAITLDGMGQTEKALNLWDEAVAFSHTKLPPVDESSVVMRVQAALCALHAGREVRAREHASVALQNHQILFGGGVTLFLRRFRRDLELPLRAANVANSTIAGKSGSQDPVDILWPT